MGDFMTHGLHQNWGKKKPTLLTAKSLGDKNDRGTISIPVITSATDSPFLAYKQKQKGASNILIVITYSLETKRELQIHLIH